MRDVEADIVFGGSRIRLDKALLGQVKRYAELAGYSSTEEFITHVLRRGRRKAPEPVGRGCCDPAAECFQQSLRNRMRRHPQADRILPPCDEIADALGAI